MYAVVATGGKQYRVEEGDVVRIEKIPGEIGESVSFDRVLMISDGDNVTIGPQAGIAKSIPSGETISGTPGIPHRLWLRVQHIIPKLPELSRRIRRLEKQRSDTTRS